MALPNPRLAGRYAKSLLDLANERGELESVYKDMLYLKDVCSSSKEFVMLLRSPVIKPDKKDKILDAITGGKISTLTASFNKLLVQKGRETFLPEIVTAFIQQYKDEKGIRIVKLTTAMPASEELKKAILDKVQSDIHSEHLELHTEVNPDIIGGFVLEVGDQLIDASVAFDLHNVKKQFQNNDFIYKIR